MTTFETPNHFRHDHDKSGGYTRFGGICSMTPVCLPGEGHHAHVSIHFRGGAVLDFDPETAAELARRLPALLEFLPIIPDVSGIATDLEEQP